MITYKKIKSEPLYYKIILGFIATVLLPLLVIWGVFYYCWGFVLSIAIWVIWGSQGRYILFVYSDSPIWTDYIHKEILPYIDHKAVVLNWSERKRWKVSLAVLAFRFYGGNQSFNPIAIVFRPFRFHREFRFYEAFKDFKHGKIIRLENMKAEFFKAIENH